MANLGNMDLEVRTFPKLCWYRTCGEWKKGQIHAWSLDCDDTGIYPVAVVEDMDDHSVRSVYVNKISFSNNIPHEE